jgi:hypothetical protein
MEQRFEIGKLESRLCRYRRLSLWRYLLLAVTSNPPRERKAA